MPRRKLRPDARSQPDPETQVLPAVPAAPPGFRAGWGLLVKCRCGRITRPGEYCCWVCEFAADGGWVLEAWSAAARWTDCHTWACERLHTAHSPAAAYLNAAWNAGSAPPPPDPQ